MSINLKKKTIIIIVDALPYFQYKKYQFLLPSNLINVNIIKIETIIGYSSGIYPSIWTGLAPDKMNFWSEFKFNPKIISKRNNFTNSSLIKKILNIFPYLPKKVSTILSITLAKFSQTFKTYSFKYPGNFDFKLKNSFSYESHKDYIVNFNKKESYTKSIFSKFKENNISYRFIDEYKFIKNFDYYNEDVIIYSNPIMDFLGHKYGPNSKKYLNKMLEFFHWFSEVLSDNKYNIILFSDHGMTSVKEKFFPIKIFKKIGLKVNKDLLVWFDSTILKIWFKNKKALNLKQKLIKEFNKINSGHFLTNEEKTKYGINFNNRYYGDLIFLVNPHFEIFPNFFNFNRFKMTRGLHGYNPTHKTSYGIFFSNCMNYEEPMNLLDIYPKLINYFNLN